MKSKITNFHTFWSSPSLQAGLQNPHERRAYTLLAEVLVFHGKFVRLSSEAGRLHFTLRGAAMFSSNILRPGKKLKRKQTRNLHFLLVEFLKKNHNIFANSVKKKSQVQKSQVQLPLLIMDLCRCEITLSFSLALLYKS